jgi:hypothetical protein
MLVSDHIPDEMSYRSVETNIVLVTKFIVFYHVGAKT